MFGTPDSGIPGERPHAIGTAPGQKAKAVVLLVNPALPAGGRSTGLGRHGSTKSPSEKYTGFTAGRRLTQPHRHPAPFRTGKTAFVRGDMAFVAYPGHPACTPAGATAAPMAPPRSIALCKKPDMRSSSINALTVASTAGRVLRYDYILRHVE